MGDGTCKVIRTDAALDRQFPVARVNRPKGAKEETSRGFRRGLDSQKGERGREVRAMSARRLANPFQTQRETTANFLNPFSGPTEISAASIDNPMITKIITQRAKAAGKDGSNGGERTTIGAIQADEGGEMKRRGLKLLHSARLTMHKTLVPLARHFARSLVVAAASNDTLLPFEPPSPLISNLATAAASAGGRVVDEFQIDEEVGVTLLKGNKTIQPT